MTHVFDAPAPPPREWRPRKPDPDHTKCGRCRRTFYAGTLPPQGRERSGPYRGDYVCRDCRADLMPAPPQRETLPGM